MLIHQYKFFIFDGVHCYHPARRMLSSVSTCLESKSTGNSNPNQSQCRPAFPGPTQSFLGREGQWVSQGCLCTIPFPWCCSMSLWIEHVVSDLVLSSHSFSSMCFIPVHHGNVRRCSEFRSARRRVTSALWRHQQALFKTNPSRDSRGT